MYKLMYEVNIEQPSYKCMGKKVKHTAMLSSEIYIYKIEHVSNVRACHEVDIVQKNIQASNSYIGYKRKNDEFVRDWW